MIDLMKFMTVLNVIKIVLWISAGGGLVLLAFLLGQKAWRALGG